MTSTAEKRDVHHGDFCRRVRATQDLVRAVTHCTRRGELVATRCRLAMKTRLLEANDALVTARALDGAIHYRALYLVLGMAVATGSNLPATDDAPMNTLMPYKNILPRMVGILHQKRLRFSCLLTLFLLQNKATAI